MAGFGKCEKEEFEQRITECNRVWSAKESLEKQTHAEEGVYSRRGDWDHF